MKVYKMKVGTRENLKIYWLTENQAQGIMKTLTGNLVPKYLKLDNYDALIPTKDINGAIEPVEETGQFPKEFQAQVAREGGKALPVARKYPVGSFCLDDTGKVVNEYDMRKAGKRYILARYRYTGEGENAQFIEPAVEKLHMVPKGESFSITKIERGGVNISADYELVENWR